ncbi:hypothetical protein [Streptomyces sp. NPDC049040]|uniref:hypothetical protein n=1 Tax=Streptomyces sp. NPDC049040 TaxID=3365593 RepID=UPI00371034CF
MLIALVAVAELFVSSDIDLAHALIPPVAPCDDPGMTDRGATSSGHAGSAAAAFAAILDRSLTQIAEAAADARHFDRETVVRISDVWDNNTYPFFRVAAALPRLGHERRARAAVRWMTDLDTQRREWAVEQAAAAGHRLDWLGAPGREREEVREPNGHVHAPVTAATQESAAGIARDYDLASAAVLRLVVERVGADLLVGSLRLALARTYPVGDGASLEPALLDVWLRDVSDIRFDSEDARGVTLRVGAEGVRVGVGSSGGLRATTGHFGLDDRW